MVLVDPIFKPIEVAYTMVIIIVCSRYWEVMHMAIILNTETS